MRCKFCWCLTALSVGFAVPVSAGEPALPLPKVVLIGDSIRRGYAPVVTKHLSGRAAVTGPETNCGDSERVLKNLDEWVIRERPVVVHFNCGIHDLKKTTATGEFQVPPDRYEANLRTIVGRIRAATTATVLFSLTTPVLDDRAAKARDKATYALLMASVEKYNGVARRVMADLGVPVHDTHAALGTATDWPALMSKDGVHYARDGYEKLGASVAAFVMKHLPERTAVSAAAERADVVIVGGMPGGITAAVAAARAGRSVILLERGMHIGGLPANGLGATDIGTRGATGGLFLEFVRLIKKHYVDTYGPDSAQAKLCSDGYHFEPRVAEQVFEQLLAEQKDRVRILRGRQFDAEPENAIVSGGRLTEIAVRDLATGNTERYKAKVFIDATYEGDLAAAAGAPYRVGREGRDEFQEALAGRLYKQWGGPIGPGSTGQADNAVQAFNYRLCLTRDPANRVTVPKPERYDRSEFAPWADDVRAGRTTGAPRDGQLIEEKHWESIGRLLNPVDLPNGKIDANNQHLNYVSSDLPEENWPWPTSGWEWRDRFARRLRDYTLGLVWFAQNDSAVPTDLRERCREWGLSKDEFADNGHFPRQAYVREGRRVVGEYWFTARDAVSTETGGRPPIHASSVTASHYSLDSHAVRKREPGRVHLDGFFSSPARPYTVPYGVIVPKGVDGLLTPVPVSGTHIGFSTLRMEPCWMALGEAAGTAAAVAVESGVSPRAVPVAELQDRLLTGGAVLMYFADAHPGDSHFAALQYFAIRGFLPATAWKASLSAAVAEPDAADWIARAKVNRPTGLAIGKTTRGELFQMLYDEVRTRPAERTRSHGRP